jgi:hypothetical protein
VNRRGFLSALIAGAMVDPERLLWVPGKKLISIPAPLYSIEELNRAFDFVFLGKQWTHEVLDKRAAAGRPCVTWNRIAPLVEQTARRRNIAPFSAKWKLMLVETVREHGDRQRMLNFLVSNEAEMRIASPLEYLQNVIADNGLYCEAEKIR